MIAAVSVFVAERRILRIILGIEGRTAESAERMGVCAVAILLRKADKLLIFFTRALSAQCGAILLMRSRVLLLDRAGELMAMF